MSTYVMKGYHHLSVCTFIHSLMQYYKCPNFGHSQTSCNGKAVCGICGKLGHSPKPYQLGPCINCKGAHAASLMNYLTSQQEHWIQEIWALQDLTFPGPLHADALPRTVTLECLMPWPLSVIRLPQHVTAQTYRIQQCPVVDPSVPVWVFR